MDTRRAVSSSLVFLLMIAPLAPAQSPTARRSPSATKSKSSELSEVEKLRSMPPVAAKQRQLCAAYREDELRHKAYEDAIAAAKDNPIRVENVKKTESEFAKLFFAKEAEVMGDGSFQDWTGIAHIELSNQQSYSSSIRTVVVQIEFPCIFTNYYYGGYTNGHQDFTRKGTPEGRCQPVNARGREGYVNDYDLCVLSLGNTYRGNNGPPLPIEAIPLASVFGQSLGALSSNEPVAVSGKIFCTPEHGCEIAQSGHQQYLYANITSLRSLKTGKVFKEPAPDFKTLSQASPFISVENDNCLEPNKEREDKLEADLKRAEADLLRLFSGRSGLPEGTHYVAVKDGAGNPVTIRGGSVPYNLFKILEEPQKRYSPCVLMPDGVPASLVKVKVPVQTASLPQGGNPKDGRIYRFLPPGIVSVPTARLSGPSQELAISKGFWLGQTEVTQEAYERVMGSNPSQFRGARLPVERVTWTEAQNYCQAIGMRLPTDLEWEYAAAFEKPLASNSVGSSDSLEDTGWFYTNGEQRTHEVARKDPNRWGFYDMLGNVAEFVTDVDVRLHGGMQSDPVKMTSAGMRLMRGGSWQNSGAWSYGRIDGRWGFVGFRCAGESLSGETAPSAVPVVASGEPFPKLAPVPPPTPPPSSDEHTLQLTPDYPAAARSATIVAPGNGIQRFNLYTIDTQAFPNGGTLNIEIRIAANSHTDGSFDLFPSNVRIPTQGQPVGTLAGRYDVRRGTTTHLTYRFPSGQVFLLGLEGNWFSPRGATGQVEFRANVRK